MPGSLHLVKDIKTLFGVFGECFGHGVHDSISQVEVIWRPVFVIVTL